MFQLITPISYWILTVLWLIILALYLGKLRHSKALGGTVGVLLTILAIDAFRTVFESAYFGLYFNSMFGILPKGVYDLLSRPSLIIIPKLINVVAGVSVLALLIHRWVPREIREREQFETKLRNTKAEAEKKEATLNAIFDGITDGIVFTDTDRRIVSVNKGMKKTFGYTLEDLVGKTTSLLYENKEDYERQGRIRFNQSAEEQSAPYDVIYRRKNGEIFVGETLGTTIKGPDGENLGYIAVTRDVTERIQAHSRLEQSEQRFRDYAAVSAEWFWEMDEKLCFSEITGQPHLPENWIKNNILGKTRIDLMSDQESLNEEKWRQHLADLEAHRPFHGFEFQQKGPGGDIWVSISAAPLFDSDGAFRGYRGSGISIAERKQTEMELLASREEAVAANRSKSEFLASMSHELRTPLNAVLGFAQLMQFDPTNPLTPKQNSNIESILSGGNHLLELVNNVLDLASIEAEQITLSLDKVNANKTLADCTSLTRPLGEPRGIKIVDLFSGGPEINLRTDPMRCKQVMINLLSNAIKYNKDGGTVTVSGQQTDDGFLRLSVADTGIGIAEEDFSEVFQMFRRFNADPMKAREGTGIGLAVTRHLVERMAGRIGFESKLGVGSTFWVELPLYSNQDTFIWRNALRIGVAAIDEDHRVIISLLNKISYRNIADDDMSMIIGELIDYTRHHFRQEEAVMEACDFPDLEAHREHHHTLEADVQVLIDNWRAGHDPKALLALQKFLRGWLIDHIANDDTKIAKYALGKDPEIRKALRRLNSQLN